VTDTAAEATAPAITSIKPSELPELGAPLADGIFSGLTTKKDGTHCAVVLLPAKPSERLDWKAAMKWAEDIDAELPTRPVAALLFANLGDQFEKHWHWTSESCDFDGSYAWNQYFDRGTQLSLHKSYEGRCRAVRLIPLVL
jgi:hypothetical protein